MTNEEAIELLGNLKVCKQAHTLFNIEKEAVDMAIDALKERPHGEWIDLGDDIVLRWVCSKCGRKDRHIFNFCPDCGADMREEGDENG